MKRGELPADSATPSSVQGPWAVVVKLTSPAEPPSGSAVSSSVDGSGSMPTCTSLANFNIAESRAVTTQSLTAVAMWNSTVNADAISVMQVWERGAATPPLVMTLSGQTMTGCQTCVQFNRGCSIATGQCTSYYMADQGTLDLSEAPRNAAGVFRASLTGVRFARWDLSTDTPVSGPALSHCVHDGPVPLTR